MRRPPQLVLKVGRKPEQANHIRRSRQSVKWLVLRYLQMYLRGLQLSNSVSFHRKRDQRHTFDVLMDITARWDISKSPPAVANSHPFPTCAWLRIHGSYLQDAGVCCNINIARHFRPDSRIRNTSFPVQIRRFQSKEAKEVKEWMHNMVNLVLGIYFGSG